MSNQDNNLPMSFAISAVERETGLSKDVLRKWESRYGFPLPERDAIGERLYPADQVARLRLIKRLLDAGMRPSRVVTETPEVLADLVERKFPKGGDAETELFQTRFLQVLRQHDVQAMRQSLVRLMYREGLQIFVQSWIAGLIRRVGEEWARGNLDIHEEHLFCEVVQGLLRGVIEQLNNVQGRPRILLTTPTGEPHGLGLLMVSAVASMEGAYCHSIGTQTPVQDISHAAEARDMDIVALSISSTYPARQIAPALNQLRGALPSHVQIWVGGDGAARSVQPEQGVVVISSIEELPDAIAFWRDSHQM